MNMSIMLSHMSPQMSRWPLFSEPKTNLPLVQGCSFFWLLIPPHHVEKRG